MENEILQTIQENLSKMKNDLNIVKIEIKKLNTMPTKTRIEHIQAKEFLCRKEVAELCGISLTAVDVWTNKGYLEKYKTEGHVYFKRAEVVKFMEGNEKINRSFVYDT